MGGKSSAGMILVALLIASVSAVLAWLFYFSPAFDDIAEIRMRTEAQQDLNETFAIQVAALRRDFERLPELEAQIREVQQDLPAIEDRPGIVRLLTALVGSQQSLIVERLQFSEPSVIGNSVTLAEAAAEHGQTSYVEELEFEGLVATWFTLNVLGEWEEVLALVQAAQTGSHRFLLVEQFTYNLLDPADASGTRPEILEGWAEGTITGVYFTLLQEGVDPRLLPGEDGEYPIWSRESLEPGSGGSESDAADAAE